MKQRIFLLCITGLLLSCSQEEGLNPDSDLLGQWKLIEILADPGDGSGTFSEVESKKTITFHPDGTVTSNGTLCEMSLEVNGPTSGSYSLTSSTFTSADCYNPDYDYMFEREGNILIISYPCIEACQAKYVKL